VLNVALQSTARENPQFLAFFPSDSQLSRQFGFTLYQRRLARKAEIMYGVRLDRHVPGSAVPISVTLGSDQSTKRPVRRQVNTRAAFKII